jgi:hypothetical protein
MLIATAYSDTKVNISQGIALKDEATEISGYTIANIDFILLASDPSKVRSITLDITSKSDECEIAEARITVDNGSKWIPCNCSSEVKLMCDFPDLQEPEIASISNVRLVTMLPIPWYKKIFFWISKIFS